MEWIGQLSAYILSMGAITAFVLKGINSSNKELKSAISDLSKKIDKKDYHECKRYLTDFLSDIRNGVKKTDIQRLQFCDTYKHYTKELDGNTWVETEYEELHKKGLI